MCINASKNLKKFLQYHIFAVKFAVKFIVKNKESTLRIRSIRIYIGIVRGTPNCGFYDGKSHIAMSNLSSDRRKTELRVMYTVVGKSSAWLLLSLCVSI